MLSSIPSSKSHHLAPKDCSGWLTMASIEQLVKAWLGIHRMYSSHIGHKHFHFLVIKIKVDFDDQLVHSKSLKPLRESTFLDLNNLFDKDGNFGVGSNVSDTYDRKIVVSQGPNETLELVLSTPTSIMRNVVD